ncbi:hypothetical protein [Saccharopolyspora pogona]|uniref:hypothetical protein n=1 Tax=Saccharopolyspora pogona TaxID=333966 RepID=UPI001CC2407E|nr:hypothetical protein [Saccharopolyspora pogona]
MRPVRLEDMMPDGRDVRSLRTTGYDLLAAGHEYPSLSAWRAVWESPPPSSTSCPAAAVQCLVLWDGGSRDVGGPRPAAPGP